jgi:hypothetical protein
MAASRWCNPLEMRRRPWLLIVAVVVALVGGVAALVLFLRPDEADELRVDADLAEPWCNDEGTICVTEESLAAGFAL